MSKRKVIKRHYPNIPLLLSTDITGIFALKPQLFYQLYHTISADSCPLDGVEFLPFRFSQHRVLQVLQKFEIPILGIHGPVTWKRPQAKLSEKLFELPFATVMPNVKTTFKQTQQVKPNYLLFHEPDLNNCCFSHQLHQYLQQDPTPIILLENVYRPQSLQISVKKAKKLLCLNQAGVTIDLVHLLMEVMNVFSFFDNYHRKLNKENIDQYWTKMLIAMDKALEQLPVASFHIPIGTNRDSLPWDIISLKNWQQLAQLIDKHQDRLLAITLENQHSENILSINDKHLPNIIKDKKQKISTLLQAGVL